MGHGFLQLLDLLAAGLGQVRLLLVDLQPHAHLRAVVDQQLVQQLGHPLATADQALGGLGQRRVHRHAGDDFRGHHDRGQRAAQVVAEHAEEDVAPALDLVRVVRHRLGDRLVDGFVKAGDFVVADDRIG